MAHPGRVGFGRYTQIMYRDETEALRARLRSLEAQLEAESRRRQAAEAETEAAKAIAYEHKLRADGSSAGGPPLRPAALAALFWPLALLMAVSTVASLYLGAWHARIREARIRPAMVHAHPMEWKKCPHMRARVEAMTTRHPKLRKVLDKPRYTTVRDEKGAIKGVVGTFSFDD